MGRKSLAEHEKKKRRTLYLTDAEWERVQDFMEDRKPSKPLPLKELLPLMARGLRAESVPLEDYPDDVYADPPKAEE